MEQNILDWLRVLAELFTIAIVPMLVWLANTLRKIDRQVELNRIILFGPQGKNGLRGDVIASLQRLAIIERRLDLHEGYCPPRNKP